MRITPLAVCFIFIFSSICFADYTDNNDGTVTDSNTGLMWQQATSDSQMTWEQAISWCENLELAGYSDWRLPNIKELASIVDYSTYRPAINETYFPGTMSSSYWSSTTWSYAFGTSNVWRINFEYGNDAPDSNKSNANYVRAVRGGQ